MRSIWLKSSTWATLVAAIALVALLTVAVWEATKPEQRTEAVPPTESEITFDMEKNRTYNADDGVVVIPATVTPKSGDAPGVDKPLPSDAAGTLPTPVADAVPIAEAVPVAAKIGGNYTLPEDVLMEDGSIGLLGIPKLSLSVNVFETEDEVEAMSHGVAHFKTTSAWSGNIGLCSHNVNFDLTDGYFKDLHTLENGDTITYTTSMGTKSYAVETVTEITETDWSYLGRTEDDRITLVTCISGKPRSRLVVQAVAAA